MIEVFIPFYIEYKNLSPIFSQAEQQKDFILLALKRLDGQNKIFLEPPNQENLFKNTDSNYLYWEAMCRSCPYLPGDKASIILDSVKKVMNNNGKSEKLSFDTVDLSGKVSSWRIELAEKRPVIVHVGSDVKINYNSVDGISIQASGKPLKNATKGELVHVQIKNWFSKNNTNSAEVIEAKVVAPNEVEYVSKE